MYPDIQNETQPSSMDPPLRLAVQTTAFCRQTIWLEINFGYHLPYTRNTSLMVFKMPKHHWKATFGSKTKALKIAMELNNAFWYKLCSFKIDIDGATRCFCNNMSDVKNASVVESTLNKKHSSIAYHKVCKSIAAVAIKVYHKKRER